MKMRSFLVTFFFFFKKEHIPFRAVLSLHMRIELAVRPDKPRRI